MAASETEGVLRAFAPAKINLTLEVRGRRGDGYHELESLVVFADVGDHLSAAPAERWGLTVTGPFADALKGFDAADNLVLRAAKMAEEWVWGQNKDLPPLHFTLEKHLPVASGIGGGSSDAGAAMRLCAAAAGLAPDDALYARAAALGADIPVCLFGQPAWMSGKGEKLSPAKVPSDLALVLVNPGVEVSTAEVFKKLRAGPVAGGAPTRPAFNSKNDLAAFLVAHKNDLEEPACEIAPVIRFALEATLETKPLIARMSGSGATCFGLYASFEDAQQAASALRSAHHDWWVVGCGLVN